MRQFACLFGMMLLLLACQPTEKQTEESKPVDPAKPTFEQTESKAAKKVLFFGNSLTAGYGLDDPLDAFPMLIQDKINDLDKDYEVVNAGLSGETTASGNNRVNWVLNQKVDIFVLELGGNDGLRGINPDETRRNLQQIIDKVMTHNSECTLVLTGMEAPPNMGEDFTSKFRAIFPELAQQNNTALVPFLLDGVGGIKELNQPDGIHPTAEGHKILAENVWKVLRELL
ncbi:MAG: arylesterase [Bacteroidota bacterium]